jgi:hypothetical protein
MERRALIGGGWLSRLPLVALLGFGVAGCGQTGGGAATAPQSSSVERMSGASAKRAPETLPTELVVSGDDDNDDYGKHFAGDGDNDDSKLRHRDRDNDADNPSGSYFDRDDDPIRRFGHAAGAADRHAVTALLEHYFTAAITADGATACSLLERLRVTVIPEDIVQWGPPYLSGTTCAAVMSKVLRLNHRQVAAHRPTLRVSDVRLEGDVGLVMLAFGKLPGREMTVRREGVTWKLDSLLDNELP